MDPARGDRRHHLRVDGFEFVSVHSDTYARVVCRKDGTEVAVSVHGGPVPLERLESVAAQLWRQCAPLEHAEPHEG